MVLSNQDRSYLQVYMQSLPQQPLRGLAVHPSSNHNQVSQVRVTGKFAKAHSLFPSLPLKDFAYVLF